MRTNREKTIGARGGLIAQLKADKKKVVMVACLIAVMAFMWIRVLTRKAPATAQATNDRESAAPEQAPRPEPVNVSYRSLAIVEGRNDRLTRDVFACNQWRAFKGLNSHNTNDSAVGIDPNTDNEEAIKKLVKQLKLEAIGTGGGRLRAFINGQVLTRGQKLLIGEGPKKIEFELTHFEDDTVTLRCPQASVTLTLTQTTVK